MRDPQSTRLFSFISPRYPLFPAVSLPHLARWLLARVSFFSLPAAHPPARFLLFKFSDTVALVHWLCNPSYSLPLLRPRPPIQSFTNLSFYGLRPRVLFNLARRAVDSPVILPRKTDPLLITISMADLRAQVRAVNTAVINFIQSAEYAPPQLPTVPPED
jgi:hypothetical protein